MRRGRVGLEVHAMGRAEGVIVGVAFVTLLLATAALLVVAQVVATPGVSLVA